MLTPGPLQRRAPRGAAGVSFVQAGQMSRASQGSQVSQGFSGQHRLVRTTAKTKAFQAGLQEPTAGQGRGSCAQPCPPNPGEIRKWARVKEGKFLFFFLKVWDDDPPAAPGGPLPRGRAGGRRTKEAT